MWLAPSTLKEARLKPGLPKRFGVGGASPTKRANHRLGFTQRPPRVTEKFALHAPVFGAVPT